ncbi:MAG: DUF2946 domain-containing protein [Alphaproteobacteria bacterium]|nr:MAG: DUF2946 domain-containing protein [Alphaproteobacteria bacterium]
MISRPLHKALWAAVLAVLIQLGAPIWAMAMLAAQPFDPVAGMPMCSEDASGDRSAPPPHHGSICLICQFAGQTGQLVLSSPPVAVAPAEIGRVSRVRYTIAEPRAPPSCFAQARAPPASF